VGQSETDDSVADWRQRGGASGRNVRTSDVDGLLAAGPLIAILCRTASVRYDGGLIGRDALPPRHWTRFCDELLLDELTGVTAADGRRTNRCRATSSLCWSSFLLDILLTGADSGHWSGTCRDDDDAVDDRCEFLAMGMRHELVDLAAAGRTSAIPRAIALSVELLSLNRISGSLLAPFNSVTA